MVHLGENFFYSCFQFYTVRYIASVGLSSYKEVGVGFMNLWNLNDEDYSYLMSWQCKTNSKGILYSMTL